MNKALLNSSVILAVLSAGTAAHAADDQNNTSAGTAVHAADDQDNDSFWGRFNLSYVAAFNISANFSGVGGYLPPGNGRPGFYNDGFVGTDSTGNAGGYTTYWGYNNASQISGGDVLMHRSVSSSVSTGDQYPGLQNGVELSYDQPLGGGKHWHWGLEGAVNWIGIGISDSHSMSGSVVTTTDGYSLNGSIPPVAPYTGTVQGPGPLLQSTPNSSSVVTVLNTAQITGNQKIDANLVGFRLGPYLELPVCKYFAFEFSGGLSFGLISSDFQYNESVAISGLPTQTYEGNGHDTGGLVGGYVRGQANVRLTHNLSLIGGVEFNDLGTFDQTVGRETAHLNLSQSIYVNAGVRVSF